MSDKPIVTRNVFGGPDMEPTVLLVDMASGIDQSVIARLRAAGGGTVFEIRELQRNAEPALKEMMDRMAASLTASIPLLRENVLRQTWFDGVNFKTKDMPSWRMCKHAEVPQWRPLLYRPRQRSASMRKHARIVRSRMAPTETRKKAAEFQHLKSRIDGAEITIPKPSTLRKELF